MIEFLLELKLRNNVLFYFGAINFILAAVFIVFSFLNPIEFSGTNAWYKPIKFALSIGILTVTTAWYTGYLEQTTDIRITSWVIVITLAFEIIYIGIQASRGEASHFNVGTPFYSIMYNLMALAASVASIAVAYIGLKFFTNELMGLEKHYLWAIRFGMIFFVIFAFQGFLMGSALAHTVGGVDGGIGLPFLNWSVQYGDLRIAHFFGMHALQVLPILAYFVFKDVKVTMIAALLYGCLAIFLLIIALTGKPIVRI